MHIADPALGIFGANGIVAAGLPIATGAATAAQLRGNDRVAVAFFGDGAAAQGAFHEALNLAAVWRLPVIFFCENNGYSEFSPASAQHAASLERNGPPATASPTVAADGNDVVATASVMRDAVQAARSGAVRPWWKRRPTAGTATTRATPSATAQRTKSGSGRRATRSSATASGSVGAGVGQAEIDRLESRCGDRARPCGRSGARVAAAVPGLTLRLRRAPAGSRARTAAGSCGAASGELTYRTMDAVRGASSPSSPPTSACFSPASTSATAATCSA